MKTRIRTAPWPALPHQRPPLAGTTHTMSESRVDERVGAPELAETWREWEAGTSSEFLNWFLFTRHGRSGTAGHAVFEDWVAFQNDRAGLDDRARAVLGDGLALLREHPDIRIVIGGIVGRRGTVAQGMILGLGRIQSIRAFLLAHGIAPGRIGIAIRGSGWSVAERSGGRGDPVSGGGEYRLQVTDSLWGLARN